MKQTNRVLVKRLAPGTDLKKELQLLAEDGALQAGVLLSLVGSLATGVLRLAGGNNIKPLQGPLEIVSATGTISRTSMHVHVSVADESGTTYGGHLLDGCKTYTTVEVVIQDLSDQWQFERVHDPATGFKELSPKPNGR